MRFGFTWLVAAVAAAALQSAASVQAQAWLSDRARAEGRGVRLGDFELHPGIGSEIGYITNVYLIRTDNTPAVNSAQLRLAPHLYLSTVGSGDTQAPVSFRAGASGSLRYYFDSDAPGVDIGVGQDARLTLRPSSVFKAEIFDEYKRSIDPFTGTSSPTTTTAPTVTAKGLNFARDMIGVGTRLGLSTPGEVFKVGAGYRFDYDYFEDGTAFGVNTNRAHTISADTSWEFLPKTALVWNGAVKLFNYVNARRLTAAQAMMMGQSESLTAHFNSTNMISTLGINGALTPRIGGTLAVGYAAGFFSDNNDYEGVVAQAEVRWRIAPTLLWALGYDRQTAPAFQGNFARADRIKTRLEAMALGALLVTLKGDLTFLSFGTDPVQVMNGNTQKRSDIQLNLDAAGEYRFVDWFAATLDVGYLQDFTSYPLVAPDGSRTSMKYNQFFAFIGVRAFL